MRIADIRIWITTKYQNTIFKQLPLLIFLYIKDHPEELEKYMSKKIIMSELLAYIYKETTKIIQLPLIKIVNDYVNEICKPI